jgi:L-ascorbate metabolism protein UlaG (beta-lactamase superfamily)
MFKMLFFAFLLMQVSIAFSRVEMRWLTVASILLDDGETKILFDPMFTRASFLHWMNLKKLPSDEKLVKAELDKLGLKKIDAVFASHSHFDHVIDAPIISKLTGAIFYVDQSSERVAKAYKNPLIRTERITALRAITVGKFRITPVVRSHSPIKFGYHFLPGEVASDFNFGMYDYHVGDTWFYYITHDEGKILLDQGSAPFLDKAKSLTDSVDVLIQGVANRKDDEMVIEGYPKLLKPKIFIPTHFDNFFFSFNPQGDSELPGIHLERILSGMKVAYPEMKVIRPKYGEKIVILEPKKRETKLPLKNKKIRKR